MGGKKNKSTVSFRLAGIVVGDWRQKGIVSSELEENEMVTYTTHPQFRLLAERREVMVLMRIRGVSSISEQEICHLEFSTIFEISEGFNEIYNEETKKGELGPDLSATLIGITYSTARGIIYERSKGTFLEYHLLPVVDPYRFVTPPADRSEEE